MAVEDVVVAGPLLVAGGIAFAAGALSFFSPCCLPLLPAYLSLVAGNSGADVLRESQAPESIDVTMKVSVTASSSSSPPGRSLSRRAPIDSTRTTAGVSRSRDALRSRTVLGTLLFVLGFSVVFTSYGAAFGGIGFLLLDYQRDLTVVLGVVTIVLGLAFCGLLQRIPWMSRTVKIAYRPPSGLAGSAMLGVLFGIGWTPCMGPTLSAVLSLSVSSGGAIRGALLAFVYSLGLGVPFLLAAVAAEQAMRWFSWPRRHARLVMTVGGGFLVAIGVLQVTGVWSALVTEMQVAVSGWQVPL